MTRYRTLGTTIAQARKRTGLRQIDIACEVGVTEYYLALIEQGRRRPSGYVARALERVLGVELRPLWEAIPMVHRRGWE